eukprot:TRINITY_DN5633_c0_g4_i2.p1 TRINITY_DN5633_c0_g4~~TRINITY_DN5633_c0_g4_i2.p1  ORF type:complete len:492 (+),score=133.96 TRINITY_DN5633_c0_g4_i2:308-1783(+)
MITNIFVAVVLADFSWLYASEVGVTDESVGVTGMLGDDQMSQVLNAWKVLDPRGTGFILDSELKTFVEALPPPLGFSGIGIRVVQLEALKVEAAGLPLAQPGRIRFREVLSVLSLNMLGREAVPLKHALREFQDSSSKWKKTDNIMRFKSAVQAVIRQTRLKNFLQQPRRAGNSIQPSFSFLAFQQKISASFGGTLPSPEAAAAKSNLHMMEGCVESWRDNLKQSGFVTAKNVSIQLNSTKPKPVYAPVVQERLGAGALVVEDLEEPAAMMMSPMMMRERNRTVSSVFDDLPLSPKVTNHFPSAPRIGTPYTSDSSDFLPNSVPSSMQSSTNSSRLPSRGSQSFGPSPRSQRRIQLAKEKAVRDAATADAAARVAAEKAEAAANRRVTVQQAEALARDAAAAKAGLQKAAEEAAAAKAAEELNASLSQQADVMRRRSSQTEYDLDSFDGDDTEDEANRRQSVLSSDWVDDVDDYLDSPVYTRVKHPGFHHE